MARPGNGGVLPPPPINTLPTGLLDFFQIKNGGEYPQTLLPQLQPVIDLYDHYKAVRQLELFMSPLRTIVANSSAQDVPLYPLSPVNPGDTGAATTVPSGQLWLVTHAQARWTFAALGGQDFDGQLVAQRGGYLFTPPADLAGFTTSVAAIQRQGVRSWVGQQWLTAGMTLSYRIFGSVGATAPAPIEMTASLGVVVFGV